MFQNIIDAFGQENLQPQAIREGVVEFLWDNQMAFGRFEPVWAAPTVEDRWAEYHRQLEMLRVEGEYAIAAADLIMEGIYVVILASISSFS